MVNVGFICEGKTEQYIIESSSFKLLLEKYGLRCIGPVFNAAGNGNLLPHKIEDIRSQLFKNGAQVIFILTDLDNDACVTRTRQRITEQENQIIIVAVRQIESWFLSDSVTLGTLFEDNTFFFENPASEADPYETLKRLFQHHVNRGVGTKAILAKRMLKNGFSIENAASHPNCPSANYFLTKLQSLQQTPT